MSQHLFQNVAETRVRWRTAFARSQVITPRARHRERMALSRRRRKDARPLVEITADNPEGDRCPGDREGRRLDQEET